MRTYLPYIGIPKKESMLRLISELEIIQANAKIEVGDAMASCGIILSEIQKKLGLFDIVKHQTIVLNIQIDRINKELYSLEACYDYEAMQIAEYKEKMPYNRYK